MGGYKIKEVSSGDKHCDYNNIKRARYFHGMLMTDRDFREEQIYHNEKRKLLNQTLHGWGVVCGLKVRTTTTPGPNIVVEPGLALDCHGNEILVCEAQTIDPCVKPSPHAEVQAGLCDAYMNDAQPHTDPTLYVMIKYKERITDPVPVYAPGGSCEEKVCDYSRTQEGYCIEVWDSLPDDYMQPPEPPESGEVCKDPFPCPDINCGPDPHYILLATISCGPRKDSLFGKLVADDGSEIRYLVERTFDKVCIQGQDDNIEIKVTDKYAFERHYFDWPLTYSIELDDLTVVDSTDNNITLPSSPIPEATYKIKATADAAEGVLKGPITLTDANGRKWTITGQSVLKSPIEIGTTEVKRGKTISEAMIRNEEQRKYVASFPWFAWLLAEKGEELPWSGDLSAYCTAENLIVTRADVMREVAKVKEDLRKETEARIKKIETDYRKKFVEMDKTIKGMTTKK